jgi:hypothetical protein
MAFQVPGPDPASIKVQGSCIVEANMKVAGSNLEYKVEKIMQEDKNKTQLQTRIFASIQWLKAERRASS